MKRILFVSHKKAKCGVYEFGKSLIEVLKKSAHYDFVHLECSSMMELKEGISNYQPAAILYNYHPSVLPFLTKKVFPKLYVSNISSIQIPQIAIIHEITQAVADSSAAYRKKIHLGGASRLGNSLFDFYIAPDPTLLLGNPLVYKTGRLIPAYKNNFPQPQIPTIGSFGFGTPNKGFDKIVDLVQQDFDEAVIRFNIPFADFGDKDGVNAKAIAEQCKNLIKKKGIQLKVTHDFHHRQSMLDFLAQNTINVFLYENTHGRGLSSTVDNALAVQRPIAVSDSIMFRHVFDAEPSVCVSKNSLHAIINNGFKPLQKYYNEWNAEQLLWEYERILHSIFKRIRHSIKPKAGFIKGLKSYIRQTISLPDKSFTWLRNTEKANEDDMSILNSVNYQPVKISHDSSLNRILDNEARNIYKPPIDLLYKFLPKTMSKKIPGANVQQGFVFDTVYRNSKNYASPKLLCVGSYEDTASMMLRRLGFNIEEIDPVSNYYLQEFFTKPSTKKNSYDIIFSTSVIEHDPDDKSFIECIENLLAPGGISVITCDYKDGWKAGDPKPGVDARFYTKYDLEKRLPSYLLNSELTGEPHWDCANPDFNYLGKYQYTFATLVFRKKR